MFRFLNTSVLENFSKHFKMLQTIQNVSNISTLFQIFINPNSKPSWKVPNIIKMLLTIQNVPNMFLAITKCLEHFIMFQNRRRRNRKESSKRKSRHAKYRPSAWWATTNRIAGEESLKHFIRWDEAQPRAINSRGCNRDPHVTGENGSTCNDYKQFSNMNSNTNTKVLLYFKIILEHIKIFHGKIVLNKRNTKKM